MVNSANNRNERINIGPLQLVHNVVHNALASFDEKVDAGLLERVDAAEVLASVASGDLPYEVTEGLIGHLESVRNKIFQGGILVSNALERFRKTVGVANNQSGIDDNWEAQCARPLNLDDDHPDAHGFNALLADLFMHNEPTRLGATPREQQLAYRQLSGIRGRDFDSSKLSPHYEEGSVELA